MLEAYTTFRSILSTLYYTEQKLVVIVHKTVVPSHIQSFGLIVTFQWKKSFPFSFGDTEISYNKEHIDEAIQGLGTTPVALPAKRQSVLYEAVKMHVSVSFHINVGL